MIKNFLRKIFKIVSYGIFFKIYGKVEKSIKINENDRIKTQSVNIENKKYKVYNISQGRLYTDRIHDTAVLLDNKIIEGPSFQLRQPHDAQIYNSKIDDNIVFTKGTPRKLINLKGSVLSLLTGGGGNNKYWHWLFDVLPRLNLCSKVFNLNKIDFFLFPDYVQNFQRETLNYLKIPERKWLSSEKFRHIKAKKLIVTDHPVVTSGNASKDIMNIPIWISNWLKENFIQDTSIKKEKIKRIYIDRKNKKINQTQQRIIANEDEVEKYLLKNDFIPIKMHEIKFTEQVELFNNAEYIVGLHGGGFANLVFCKPGTKVLELRSSTAGAPVENLAKQNNLKYNSIVVESKQINKFSFPNQQGSIQIPISTLSKVLEN